MSESRPHDSSFSTHQPSDASSKQNKFTLWPYGFLMAVLAPVVAAVLLYKLNSFDPAPLPTHELPMQHMVVPMQNSRVLQGAQMIGVSKLLGPEDLAYDPDSRVIYTGCSDGWIKKVKVNESVADFAVENWVNTGGRPLGLILAHNNEVIVADIDKGLLKVTGDGKVELLTDEAEGTKFGLINGVDVADSGVIYFTDASSKYKPHPHEWLEGRPYGRFMSYDPLTRQTRVLVRDLYFANGVAVSPDQSFIVFCETPMRRCKRYYIQGEHKGSVDIFIDNLPGMPDNIRYDGEGQFWIGLLGGRIFYWDLAQRYPLIRKIMAIIERCEVLPFKWKYDEILAIQKSKNSGILAVDLEGNPLAHCYDPGLSTITGGIKIGGHLYCSSFENPYIIRLDLTLIGLGTV
ncbi:strictosidine synthase [Sarracenia purpurea var. burkii]